MRITKYFLGFLILAAVPAIATARKPAAKPVAAAKEAKQTKQEATDSILQVLNQAKAGNAEAQNEVGGWYYRGRHVNQNFEEALQWWSKAAKQGNVKAIGNMGLCYQTGHGIAQDSLMATQLYQKSIEKGNKALFDQNVELADQGSVFSCMLIASCYLEGKGIPRDVNKALPFLVKAGDKGCVDAQKQLGVIYLNGKKYEEALKWFKKGTENGDVNSTFFYGKMLMEGMGVKADKKEGANYMLKAAGEGFPQAMYYMGDCYLHGDGVTRNAQQAVKWYRLAAGKHLPKAEWTLAQCFREGIGTDVNYHEALYWYAAAVGEKGYDRQFKTLVTDSIPNSPFVDYLRGVKLYVAKDDEAALKEFKKVEKAGIADGKVMQGVILMRPTYPKQNVKKGIKLLTEASATNPMALYSLGMLYEAGKGVDMDMPKAVHYITMAAEKDYAPAECALADMYFEGRGVDQNYDKAVKWYAKAYEQGQLTENAAKRYASCYQEGKGGLEPDEKMATEILESATNVNYSAVLSLI